MFYLLQIVFFTFEIFHKLNPLVFRRIGAVNLAHFSFEIIQLFKFMFFHPGLYILQHV